MSEKKPITSIVKAVGGKSWLLPTLDRVVPDEVVRGTAQYFEPFLGGASVFKWFNDRCWVLEGQDLPSKRSYFLGDTNTRLINLYQTVKTAHAEVLAQYEAGRKAYKARNEPDREKLYYHWRNRLNTQGVTDLERAATMLLVNRSCFNGLHRENKKGELNVPWGKHRSLPDLTNAIDAFHEISSQADFCCAPWGWIRGVSWVGGSFVYLDPPYSGTFCGYGSKVWKPEDDLELAEVVQRMAQAGVWILWSLPDNEYGNACMKVAPPTSLLLVSKAGVISAGERTRQHELLASYNFQLGGTND